MEAPALALGSSRTWLSLPSACWPWSCSAKACGTKRPSPPGGDTPLFASAYHRDALQVRQPTVVEALTVMHRDTFTTGVAVYAGNRRGVMGHPGSTRTWPARSTSRRPPDAAPLADPGARLRPDR